MFLKDHILVMHHVGLLVSARGEPVNYSYVRHQFSNIFTILYYTIPNPTLYCFGSMIKKMILDTKQTHVKIL